MMIQPTYNERSWAIDLISEINAYTANRRRTIRRAGGEYTLKSETGQLFPDVLLFGAAGISSVLQGWELKMPDTPITDIELITNAAAKARRLGLNSFLVWNVSEAVLYVKNSSDVFVSSHCWGKLPISKRADVQKNTALWQTLLISILDDLNDILESGRISTSLPVMQMSDQLLVDIIESNTKAVSAELTRIISKDALLNAVIKEWWHDSKLDYPDIQMADALAKVNITNWLIRFLFAHYLKRYSNIAKKVDTILPGTSISQAINVFNEISTSADFMHIFKPFPSQEILTATFWSTLLQLNAFLIDFKFEGLRQEVLQEVLDNALFNMRKKIAGQFATPRQLAELLVRLAVYDKGAPVLDPCCGTGTIARAVYEIKKEFGISIADAINSTWGSDKFPFPLQLATLALSEPEAIDQVLQIFQHDVFSLETNETLQFVNPLSGKPILLKLPHFKAIVSNLPFVRFEDKSAFNPLTARINKLLSELPGNHDPLDTKSDLYAFITISLYPLLSNDGKLGIIVSNSWLGTEWGIIFRDRILQLYFIESVVVSGQGRWFANADVVTSLIVLKKRGTPQKPAGSEKITFARTLKPIGSWDANGREQIANSVLLSNNVNGLVAVNSYKIDQIEQFESLGVGWNAFFTDLSWLSGLESRLIKAQTLFTINRGERRGWDDLFFPAPGHGIESDYIKPVLKTAKSVHRLITEPDEEAFCCSLSIADLKRKKQSGTINWITKYSNAHNHTGKLLPKVLARPNHHWYEMKPNTLADFVAQMNPDRRIFIARLRKRAFVNQRLIRFTARKIIDVNLCHALLNSILSIFFLEAIGFGRGLAALDLNATKLRKSFQILNPAILSKKQIKEIISAFKPLLSREILPLEDELLQNDREIFDSVLLNAFNCGHLHAKIKEAFLDLYKMRQTVRE